MTIDNAAERIAAGWLTHKQDSPWKHVPLGEWRDRVLPLTPAEQRTIERALERFRFAVTPYYASLMDPADPACPIRRQAVPGAGR